MNTKIEVKEDLTPENADEKNFVWEKDIIYDSNSPAEALTDLYNYIEKGYIFGQPASSASDNNFVGLYSNKQSI